MIASCGVSPGSIAPAGKLHPSPEAFSKFLGDLTEDERLLAADSSNKSRQVASALVERPQLVNEGWQSTTLKPASSHLIFETVSGSGSRVELMKTIGYMPETSSDATEEEP